MPSVFDLNGQLEGVARRSPRRCRRPRPRPTRPGPSRGRSSARGPEVVGQAAGPPPAAGPPAVGHHRPVAEDGGQQGVHDDGPVEPPERLEPEAGADQRCRGHHQAEPARRRRAAARKGSGGATAGAAVWSVQAWPSHQRTVPGSHGSGYQLGGQVAGGAGATTAGGGHTPAQATGRPPRPASGAVVAGVDGAVPEAPVAGWAEEPRWAQPPVAGGATVAQAGRGRGPQWRAAAGRRLRRWPTARSRYGTTRSRTAKL